VQIPDLATEVRQVEGMDGYANIGVTIVNNSLMPSGIVGAGFDFRDQIYWFREPEIRDERTPLRVRQRRASADFGREPTPLGRRRFTGHFRFPLKAGSLSGRANSIFG